MSRVLNGYYRQPFPNIPATPHVSGLLLYDDRHAAVAFLLDTGADITVLSANDAAELFGQALYQRLGEAYGHAPVTGVGATEAVVVPLTVAFDIPGGLPLVFHQPVLVTPAPSQPQPPDAGVRLPSLLGRDILNHFILLLNPEAGLVELTELDAAPA